MKKVILKKENGVVTEGVRVTLVGKGISLQKGEECFSEVMNQSEKNFEKSDITSVQKVINTMFQTITKNGVGTKVIAELYNRLKNAETKEDLLEIINLINKGYNQILLSTTVEPIEDMPDIRKIAKFDEQVQNNFELVSSIIIKKIVSMHYLNVVQSLGKDKINNLQNLKMNGSNIEEIMKYLGETFNETSISNGVERLSKKIFSDTIDIVFDRLQTHLCWENCTKASVLECKKVADQIKQKIGEYDFITDGYQILDQNGEIESFIVTGCENYVKAKPKVLTAEDRKKLKNAQENLRITYFDASTLEEAYLIQDDLVRSGKITNIRGKKPTEEQMKRIRKKLRPNEQLEVDMKKLEEEQGQTKVKKLS